MSKTRHGGRPQAIESRKLPGRESARASLIPIRVARGFSVLVLAFLLAAGCTSGGDEAVPTFSPPPTRVSSSTETFLTRTTYGVTTGTLRGEISASGDLVARQQVDLVFEIAGMVRAIDVAPGQQVRAGTVIAELDASTQEQVLLQRQSSLAITKLNLAEMEDRALDTFDLAIAGERVSYANALVSAAQAQYREAQENNLRERKSNLTIAQLRVHKLEAVSGNSFDLAIAREQVLLAEALATQASSQTVGTAVIQQQRDLAIAQLSLAALEAESEKSFELDVAREQVVLAEALAAIAQAQYEDTSLKAPFAGTIIAFYAQPGRRVDAYETIGVLADLDVIEARGMLPVDVRDRVAIGDPAQVRIYGFGSDTFTGIVTELAEEAVALEGGPAYAIVVTLDEGQSLPRVAQVGADIIVTDEVHVDVPWVPTNALITLGTDTYLDILTEDGIERVVVETGIVEGSRIEIVHGVQAGDTIVIP